MLLTDPLSSCHADPLVSYGHHFGHTVHALCNVQALITKGLLHMREQAHLPGLEDRLLWEDADEEVAMIAEKVY